MRLPTAWLALVLLLVACADKPGPAVVEPADDGSNDAPTHADLPDGPGPTTADTTRPEDTHGGNPDASGIWVEDADGVSVGMLVRRGSDDQIASRAIYDIVTVYHPVSGLFFEITMSDGIVRLPQNTFFEDGNCNTPMGIGIGTCQDCKAGYGYGFMHGGKWWRVVGGSTWQTMGPNGIQKGGLTTDCIAHGTGNAKGFPVVIVAGDQPPTTFATPLRFTAR